MNTKILALSALSMLSAFASTQASATNLFDPTVSATTIADGSSVRLDGTIHSFGPSAGVWTADVFAAPGECLRLFVSSTSFDSELTVIAPNGSVYRNDDGGGSLRPLVKIAGAPNNGWYTVHVGQFSGTPTEANFTLLYGRYSAGNVNCSGGTAPFSASALSIEPPKDALTATPAAAPRANTPGAR